MTALLSGVSQGITQFDLWEFYGNSDMIFKAKTYMDGNSPKGMPDFQGGELLLLEKGGAYGCHQGLDKNPSCHCRQNRSQKEARQSQKTPIN